MVTHVVRPYRNLINYNIMCYILIILFLVLGIVFAIMDEAYEMEFATITSFVFSFLIGLSTIIAGAGYNSTKSTADAQIAVLQSQNQIVLSQIEPLVEKALTYESNTYKELKLTPEKIVSFAQLYPELKANELVQTQIQIILDNQKEIKTLQLSKAKLNAYHFWLWTKKVE
jgi:hypothetical protein